MTGTLPEKSHAAAASFAGLPHPLSARPFSHAKRVRRYRHGTGSHR